MERKLTSALVKEIDSKEEGVIEAIGSSQVVDRMGEVIDQAGWDLGYFKKNPVILWGHNLREERPPIGKATKVWIDGEGKKAKLMFRIKFDLQDNFAYEIWRKFKEGFMNTFSVGFMGLERVDNVFTKSELLELSAVPVPANPDAAITMRSKGMTPTTLEEVAEDFEVAKSVVPFSATPALEKGAGWDGGEARKQLKEWGGGDWGKYKKGFAWFDEANAETVGAYKLPHHNVIAGELKTNWRGVVAAMGALMGARGGTNIPDDQRRAVYNHLAKHYGQFNETAPDFKCIEDQVLKDFVDENMYTEEEVESLLEKAINSIALILRKGVNK